LTPVRLSKTTTFKLGGRLCGEKSIMAELVINSKFGGVVFRLVRTLRFEKILEIGSFDGDGSTQVLIEAMKPFATKRLVCLELREDRFQNLVRNTSRHPWVELVNASSISWKSFSNRDFDSDIWPHYAGASAEDYARVKSWWQSDVSAIQGSFRAYLEEEEEFFDAVLIDGGEFSGYDEYRVLRKRTDCFILDDVFKAFKNNRVFKELSDDGMWSLLHADRDDRNGTAIFVRKDRLNTTKHFGVRACLANISHAANVAFSGFMRRLEFASSLL